MSDNWRVVAQVREHYIAVDDHCYVFLTKEWLGRLKDSDKAPCWGPSPWWPEYAIKALKQLPDNPDEAKRIDQCDS